MGPLKQMGLIRLHFLGISHISQVFLQCMKSSLTLHEDFVQLFNLSMQFSSNVVKVPVELVDADVVQVLESNQDQFLPLCLTELHLFSVHEVKVHGCVGSIRGTKENLWQSDLLDWFRDHSCLDWACLPGLERSIDRVGAVAEAGNHDHCPNASS